MDAGTANTKGNVIELTKLHNQYKGLLSLCGIPLEKAHESGVSWNDPLWEGKSTS